MHELRAMIGEALMDRREFAIKVVSPAAFTVALFVVWEAALQGPRTCR